MPHQHPRAESGTPACAGTGPIPARRAELAHLLRLGVPLAGANLAELAMVITDTAIVGRLGAHELAAVGLCGGVLFDALAIVMGVLTVVGVLVAEGYGAGDRGRTARTLWHGLAVAALLAVPMTALALVLGTLLGLTGQEPRVLQTGEMYLDAVMFALLPAMLYGVLVDVVTALHQPRVVFAISLGAVLVNAALSYGLVFGAAGLPALGVAGAGYATSAVNWLMFGALAAICTGSGSLRAHLSPRVARESDYPAWREITRLGAPVVGITVAESGMFTVVTIVMGRFGAAALAATRIVFGFVQVASALAFALADAASIRVALGMGAGAPRHARRAGRLALVAGLVLLAGLALVAVVAPGMIVAAFLGTIDPGDAPAAAVAMSLLGIGAVYLVASGLQTIAEHLLRGLRDTLVPMWLSMLGLWPIGLGGGLVLAFALGLGPAGLWWGLVLGSVVTAAAFVARFHRLLSPTARPDE